MTNPISKLSRRTREKLVDRVFLSESIALDLDPEDEDGMIEELRGLSDQELQARAARLPKPGWAAPINAAYRPDPPAAADSIAIVVVERSAPPSEKSSREGAPSTRGREPAAKRRAAEALASLYPDGIPNRTDLTPAEAAKQVALYCKRKGWPAPDTRTVARARAEAAEGTR